MFGFLLLRTGLLSWERKYFLLDENNHTLAYANDPTSRNRTTISLVGAVVAPVKEGQTKRFQLTIKKKEYMFKADTPEQCVEWMNAIYGLVNHCPRAPKAVSVSFLPTVTVSTFECEPPKPKPKGGRFGRPQEPNHVIAMALRSRLACNVNEDGEEEEPDPAIKRMLALLEDTKDEGSFSFASNFPEKTVGSPMSPGAILATYAEPLKVHDGKRPRSMSCPAVCATASPYPTPMSPAPPAHTSFTSPPPQSPTDSPQYLSPQYGSPYVSPHHSPSTQHYRQGYSASPPPLPQHHYSAPPNAMLPSSHHSSPTTSTAPMPTSSTSGGAPGGINQTSPIESLPLAAPVQNHNWHPLDSSSNGYLVEHF